ncbi:MAG: hypothetical protein GC154_07170 [bacterium]|nr:hypothetical protein [bacterium]
MNEEKTHSTPEGATLEPSRPPAESAQKRSRLRTLLFGLIAILFGIAAPLLILEIALRFFPVCQIWRLESVDADHPVKHMVPNQTFLYSKSWYCSPHHFVHVNNYGFVNDQDYDPDDTTPLLAVVGDSYIESLIVPYPDTIQGRLAKTLSPDVRVYSFGLAGAPLSQYLIWAKYARDTFGAQAFVIVVVGNDFDESLTKYQPGYGFYQFDRKPDGDYQFVGSESRASLQGRLLMASSGWSKLVAYLYLNLRAIDFARSVLNGEISLFPSGNQYAGNVEAHVDRQRLDDCFNVSNLFLDRVKEYTGAEPSQVMFIVDGVRPQLYNEAPDKAGEDTFWGQVRGDFITRARDRGYRVADMQQVFRDHYQQHQQKFEFPNDGHWNSLGDQIAAEQVLQSRFIGDNFDLQKAQTRSAGDE